MSIESKVYLDLARIWNLGPGEVETIVRDYIGAVTCDFKPLQTYPKPHIKPVKVKTLKERLEEAAMHEDCYFCIKRDICTKDVPKPCRYSYTEDQRKADQASDIYGAILAGMYLPKTYQKKKEETKMEATSTQTFKDIIAVDFELQMFPNEDDKFIISATNRDDIFCFVFEGSHLADACRKAGLFAGWEKDQKIRELEKELGRWKKEASDCLRLRDEAQKEAYKLKKENEKLKKELDLEKAANEAQRKFIKEYAGKDTEVTFNYAISSGPITYGLYDKDYVDELRKKNNNLIAENVELKTKLRYKAKSADDIKKFKEQIKKLESLKTPTIENFADEEPSSRRDILRCAEKCVCGHREQDYGSPESNFQLIADLWNQYLFKEPGAKEVFGIGPMDVSMMMALMKIARIRNGGGSGDSFVDLAGYAACGGEIWHSNKETNGDSSQETN